MAKFKKGDRVRCIERDFVGVVPFEVGRVVYVEKARDEIFWDQCGNIFWTHRWKLAPPEPIPETVTIGGIEYVRKPEPEHVWAWGQWARVDAKHKHIPNEKVFVTGPTKVNGWVPVSHPKGGAVNYTDGICPTDLTYLGTADIPQ